MSIAITGATGQLGSHVIATLRQRIPATEIVAVVRDPAKAAALAAQGVAVRTASYDDATALRSAFVGVDRLLFISGSEIGRRGPQHRNVIEAATAAGVERILYTSVLNLDGVGAHLPVAPDHILTEQLIRESGLAYTLLRNGWYSENFAGDVQLARATGALITGAGSGRVASAARADYAEAAAAALLDDRPGNRVHELAGDVAWTAAELAETIAQIIDSPVRLRELDPDAERSALAEAGLPEAAAGFQVGVDAAVAEGALDGRGDRTLSELIGHPTTPLEAALRAVV